MMHMARTSREIPTRATAHIREAMLEQELHEITLLKVGWYYYWFGHGYVMPVGYEDGLSCKKVRKADEFSLNSWLRRAQMADGILRMYKESEGD